MRIFMLVPPPSRGPVPKITELLTTSLRSLGCSVVTHPWGRRGETESHLNSFSLRLRDLRAARHVVRNQFFDVAVVVTSHDWRTLLRDIAAVALIRRRCRRVILHLHGSRASRLVERGHLGLKLATNVLLVL